MGYIKVAGCTNYEVNEFGSVRNIRTGRVLSQGVRSGDGYLSVTLYSDGVGRSHYVHRLVALAHVSGHFTFAQVNHKDCDKSNNQSSNLEWCSPQQNTDHKVAHGLAGAKKPALTQIGISALKRMKREGYSNRSIALELNISKTTVAKYLSLS